MIKWFFAGAGAAIAVIFVPAGISVAREMRREYREHTAAILAEAEAILRPYTK